jgi:ABC-type transporter Mla MlaB component
LAESPVPRPETAPARVPDRSHALVIVAALSGSVDVSMLCEQARALLAVSDADVIICDVGSVDGPDLRTVDALARLALTAARLGRPVMLRDAVPQLRELLDLAGLAGVVPCVPASGGEPGR